MNPQQYFSFFEKVTRKLADTFTQINLLCQQQIFNCTQRQTIEDPEIQKKQTIQLEEPLMPQPDASLIEVDSPLEEPIVRSPKTKKIKKETVGEQEEKENESMKSKKKIKKVSHKPKAPASSFLQFFKDQQPNISSAYPSCGVTELTKVAAKLWSELDPELKKPYIEQCDEERKNYQIKMKKYRQEFPQEIAEKEKDRQLRKQRKGGLKQTLKKQKSDPSFPRNTITQDSKAEGKGPQITEQLKIVAEESDLDSIQIEEEEQQDSLGIV